MQLINLSALALFATSTLAADCFGNRQDGIEKFEQAYWDARQKMCSNSDCAYQQGCTTRGSKTLKGLASITVNVELSRKNTGGKIGFKDCWDATENIITQCVRGTHQLSGTWEYDGQLYQANGYYS
ncbi:hypothetical protein FVEG_03654 [Fusarium verticillioides 7600]|uniref:Uncharacterized protein n=1 Tax=Gibberella moniliformis (strain M3125 / FGSC 7600) TaxID=334819 RepID=W7M9H7_GIBM7|nr:hypothetical protein FVEG_03654 [Fusarium verticillioides 7600]EWG41567.1 hypothetical protein FVEG_03654 [Fusarium verticillioides 7600]RBQ79055.1 hypothetical protein FVER14953_03654 [Fusarium verticillioides]RBQ89271.1 hypothetical protein FVER53263_03654 [Fusarium verticillioides]RBR20589.1 hypothetical protein FVER53590_03654 [Fusarium verticillioides]